MHEFLGSDFIIAAQLSLSPLWIFHTVFEAPALHVTCNKNKETLSLILSSEDVSTFQLIKQ